MAFVDNQSLLDYPMNPWLSRDICRAVINPGIVEHEDVMDE